MFLVVQNWINNIILDLEIPGKASTSKLQGNISSVIVPSHLSDPFLESVSNTAQIFVVLPVIITFLRMLFRILNEKVILQFF